MKQAIMTEPGKISFIDVPKPSPGKGEVLIRIISIGVCGSDIHVYHGKHPYTSYPVVQGHEVVGEVELLGEGTKGLAINDKVVIMPQVVCGKCYPCTSGKYNICDNLQVMGFQTTGMASEYFTVDMKKVIRLPDNMSFDEGALVEPLAVAVHALHRAGNVSGSRVLVLGAGPIGNLTAQAALGLGAKAVMITDISDYRLEIAASCGVTYCINTSKEDISSALLRNFGIDRADIILECVGAQQTVTQAVANARKGSTIVIVGVFGEKPIVDLGLVQDRELMILGTLMYREEDYRDAITLISSGKVLVKPLISGRYKLNDYNEAYKHIDQNQETTMKIIIMVKEN